MATDKKVKILQFGEGNFLRCFVDWMVDIMNEKADFGAAVQIVQCCAAWKGASPWSCSARSRA